MTHSNQNGCNSLSVIFRSITKPNLNQCIAKRKAMLLLNFTEPCIRSVVWYEKGGKDFTPCRPNRIRTSEQKNCPVLCGFTVLSLLLRRLVCILLIPRCEPTLIMHPCYQEHLTQRLKAHHDCHMVFRLITEFRNDQSLFVSLAGAAVGNKQEICFVGRYQLCHAGKAFPVRPCPPDGSELSADVPPRHWYNGVLSPFFFLLCSIYRSSPQSSFRHSSRNSSTAI